jgi:ABC-type Fe3+ transport system permease subunit
LPGALTGEALVTAFDHASLGWVYDRWPILSVSYVARFGWIGVLAARLVMERTEPAILDAARLDRADRATILWTIYAKAHASALLTAFFVVAALSLAEVAASSLVRVPSFNPVAQVLMEKFHRFEDGMLVSLSLWLVAATLPAVVLVAWASRRR